MAKKVKAAAKRAAVTAANAAHEERQKQYTKAAEILTAAKDDRVKSELYAKVLEVLNLEDEKNCPVATSKTSTTLSPKVVKTACTPSATELACVDVPASDNTTLRVDPPELAQGYELVFPSTVEEQRSYDDSVDHQIMTERSSVNGSTDSGDIMTVAATDDAYSITGEVEATSRSPHSYFAMMCVGCPSLIVAVSFERELPGVMVRGASGKDGLALRCCRDCWVDKRQAVTYRGGKQWSGPVNVLQAAFLLVDSSRWMETTKTITGRQVPLLNDEDGGVAAVDESAVYKELLVGEFMCSVTPDQCGRTGSDDMWTYGLQGGVLQY